VLGVAGLALLEGDGGGALATISVIVEPAVTVEPAVGLVSITIPGAIVGSLRR
jgi:hypothetical protein